MNSERFERHWKLFSEDGCGKLLKTVLGEFLIVVEYPSEEKIISAIQQGFICFSLTEEERKRINELIDTLGEREADVVKQYFGINQERKTLKEIAESYNLSGTRIGQIRKEAIRRLRHSSRFKVFRDIISPVKFQDEIDDLKKELKKALWKSKELDKYREAAIILAPLAPQAEKEEEEEKEEEKKEKKIPIEELELSVRTSNGLKGAEIKTLGELCTYTPSRLLRCRNFGRKSLQEVTQVLAEYGLSLAE